VSFCLLLQNGLFLNEILLNVEEFETIDAEKDTTVAALTDPLLVLPAAIIPLV
jgi:hypothetical protein